MICLFQPKLLTSSLTISAYEPVILSTEDCDVNDSALTAYWQGACAQSTYIRSTYAFRQKATVLMPLTSSAPHCTRCPTYAVPAS